MSGVSQYMASVTQLSVHVLVLHGLLFETAHDITSALTLQWRQQKVISMPLYGTNDKKKKHVM